MLNFILSQRAAEILNYTNKQKLLYSVDKLEEFFVHCCRNRIGLDYKLKYSDAATIEKFCLKACCLSVSM